MCSSDLHGLLLRYDDWMVETRIAGGDAMVEGVIDWAADEALMQAFPFPHRLRVAWSIGEGPEGVHATSTLVVEPEDEPVPVAAGWHPYLAPPAASRDELSIVGPELRRIPLDPRGLPELDDGGRLRHGPVESLDGPLADRT